MTTADIPTPFRAVKQLPFVRGHPVLGMLPAIRDHPLETLVKMHEDHGDIVSFRFFTSLVHSVRDPASVGQLLVTDREVWQKKSSATYDALREMLGDGLVTSEGATWLKHRRLAQPAFHRDALARMARQMVDVAESVSERFERAAKDGVIIDVANEMLLVTQRIIGLTMLGVDLDGPRSSRLVEALVTSLHFVERRSNQPIRLPLSWPLPAHTRFTRARGILDGVVLDLIRERRERRAHRAQAGAADLLDLLMDAVDEETGDVLDDGELRDEVMTMFLAGHETTANLLSWTWALLRDNPQHGEALAGAAIAAGGRSRVDPARLREAPLIDRVLLESLRLMPPVWAVDRVAERDTVLGGYAVAKGSYAILSPYCVHRNPALWSDPLRFDPARFLPEAEQERPKLAYLPFLAGNRKCIGEQFAMLEARVVLATLAARFHVTPVATPRPAISVTMRPSGGMPSRIARR